MRTSSWTERRSGSCAAELRMVDDGQRDVPHGEAVAHLGEGGADHRLLLRDGGGAEPVPGGEGLRGEQGLAGLRGEQPAVAVADEDHALQHIANRPPHVGYRNSCLLYTSPSPRDS